MFTQLRTGEAVLVIAALEGRTARCLAVLHALIECLKRAIYAPHHVLQDLGIDYAVWQSFFDAG
jgi:hypothetical protein